MVKILGAVMTGFACGYLGFKISFAMKIRAESLNNIITSLEMLESEINFSMNKLKQAFMRVDKCGLFKFAAENMDEKGVKTAWTNAVNECSTKLSLKDADKDILMTLGKNIGRTENDDQIKNIKYIKSMIAEQEKQAQSEYRRDEKIARQESVKACYEEMLKQNQCVSLKTLAVTGRDLIQAGYKPGPELGEILNRLLEHVLDVPEDNTKEKLMSLI